MHTIEDQKVPQDVILQWGLVVYLAPKEDQTVRIRASQVTARSHTQPRRLPGGGL